MHKNEHKVNPTLINHVIRVDKLRTRTTKTHKSIGSLRIQFWSWFNIPLKKINCTLILYVNNNEMKLGFVTYYPLPVGCPWIGVHNLTRLPLQSLSYKSYLLYDQLTYSNFKEHTSNSTKGIIVAKNFMITCHLDHLRGHIVSFPWDIIMPLLRILIVTSFHQQWPNT